MADAPDPVPSGDARLAAGSGGSGATSRRPARGSARCLCAAVCPLRPDADREPPVPARQARQHGHAGGGARRVPGGAAREEPRAHRASGPAGRPACRPLRLAGERVASAIVTSLARSSNDACVTLSPVSLAISMHWRPDGCGRARERAFGRPRVCPSLAHIRHLLACRATSTSLSTWLPRVRTVAPHLRVPPRLVARIQALSGLDGYGYWHPQRKRGKRKGVLLRRLKQ